MNTVQNEKSEIRTIPLYYQQPYLTETEAEIISAELKGANYLIELNQTIFYPEGGGQPNDQGEIIGSNGRQKVELVQVREGRILHQGKVMGTLQPGEKVKLQIKWSFRHQNMRTHAAGHLVHDVLMSLQPGLTPVKGSHGSKAFLQYSGPIDSTMKEALEKKVNEVLAQDLPIITKESSFEEIQATCQFVPAGLPKNKPLRTLKIGTFHAMPDGGVHVKSTKEIGKIIIQELTSQDNVTVLKYRTAGAD